MLLWKVACVYIYIGDNSDGKAYQKLFFLLELIIHFIVQTEFKNNNSIVLNQQRTINFLVFCFVSVCSCCLCIGSSVYICQLNKDSIKQLSGRQEHFPVPPYFDLSPSQLVFISFDRKLVCFVLLSYRKLPCSSRLSVCHSTVRADPWHLL